MLELKYEIKENTEFHVLGLVLENIPFMEGPKHIPQRAHGAPEEKWMYYYFPVRKRI